MLNIGSYFWIWRSRDSGYDKAAFFKETWAEKVDTYVFRIIAIFDYFWFDLSLNGLVCYEDVWRSLLSGLRSELTGEI